ncbi:hypothetical protein [Kitasatospora purpeofusca]|uniref:hypothetical protein n=1 Tax=Kitasatospora purpeofusca TaxID=67352 RepID=UPI00381AE1F7
MNLTEQLPVAPPPVAGLLRLSAAAQARFGALSAVLADFCTRRELHLTKVFTEDSDTDPDRVIPDLIAAHPNLYGIVLPSLAHLGTGSRRRDRRRQLTEAGIQLLVVRGSAGPPGRAGTRATGRRPGTLPGRRHRGQVAPRLGGAAVDGERYWRRLVPARVDP